jgi:prepilin-type N-terminal cleavage/methylation domain-containing protein
MYSTMRNLDIPPHPAARRAGFTFAEVLVAMLMLGLLSAIAVPRFRLYKERAYLATLRSDLGNLRLSEESYFAEHQRYATDTAGLELRITSSVRVALSSADPIGGYAAVATHTLLPGQQCATYVGMAAVNAPSGAIICGPASSSSATLTP